jgi:DNA-binding MarR family transcriptional regulator
MSQEVSQSRFVFSQCVRHIRTWEDAHLPLSQSRIAFDLFMLIGHSSQVEQPLTLKELFNSLKYSERGVRYVLEQFVDSGWCEIVGSEQDRRFRLVVATQRLIDKLIEYEQVVLGHYRSSFLAV